MMQFHRIFIDITDNNIYEHSETDNIRSQDWQIILRLKYQKTFHYNI